MWVLEMKIEIGDKNRIKNSNIGNNNTINKDNKSKKVIVDIIVGILVTVIGGLILYHLTK